MGRGAERREAFRYGVYFNNNFVEYKPSHEKPESGTVATLKIILPIYISESEESDFKGVKKV